MQPSTLSRLGATSLSVGLALALTIAPALADTPASGYQLASQPSPAPFAATCTLPGGDIVTFDGLSVDRWTSDGFFVGNLATLPASTFSSFVIATPDGSAVVFGENSNGGIFLAQADGSGVTPLVSLTFNYDADWLPNGDLLVSAATGGFGAGNDLVRLTLNPPAAVFLGHVDGPSGPVAIAANGDLFYATQVDSFPPPAGSTDVVRWDAADVAAGGLSLANATVVGAGFDGASSLAIDPVGGEVYLAETNFGLSQYLLRRVGAAPASSPLVVDAVSGFFGGLEFVPGGTSPGSFAAYQPADGVNLKYNVGTEQVTVKPLRPQLAISGPGTTGPGTVTFTVTGGVPNGIMLATACPTPFVQASDSAYQLPTFLWVTPFTLAETRRASAATPIFLDANGQGTFQIFNSGGLSGVYAWQFLVGDGASVLLGSTSVASF
ncbi:MAG TPA: hypothetical protein VMT18_03155 [Planctomycetota bacterium]|nr:hypothetical protein [Planctomycetota bacterium]